MSRSYRKSPVNYTEMPMYSKKMSNRKFRRTAVIDEDNTEASVAGYRRIGGYDQWDVRGWRSRCTEDEFKKVFRDLDDRYSSDSDLSSAWARWYRRK